MRIIKNFPNYQISEQGIIQNIRTGRILKHSKNQKGYRLIRLSNNGKAISTTIHKLVYITYLGEIQKGLEINHIDGNKDNNSISNLELVTKKMNLAKAVLNGQIKSGENCLSSVQVKQINTITNETIAIYGSISIATKKTKIPSSCISLVINGYRITAGGFKWEKLNNNNNG